MTPPDLPDHDCFEEDPRDLRRFWMMALPLLAMFWTGFGLWLASIVNPTLFD